MAVYLLHYTERIGGAGRNGAQHYVGYAESHNLEARLEAHRKGRSGAKITAAFAAKRIPFVVAHIWWTGTRTLERYLKSKGHHERNCPLCHPEKQAPSLSILKQQARADRGRAGTPSPKPTMENGGVSSHGSPTDNTIWSQAELLPASATSSVGRAPNRVPMIGGNVGGVRAPRRWQAFKSAGTKEPSPSG